MLLVQMERICVPAPAALVMRQTLSVFQLINPDAHLYYDLFDF